MKLNRVHVINSSSAAKPQIENPNKKSFHQAVGPCIAFGQIFGLIPVDGILGEDEDGLEFRWKSVKTIFSMAFLFFACIESGIAVRRLLRLGLSLGFAEGLFFFLFALIRGIIFFRLGTKWKKIMRKWRDCENAFLHVPYQVVGWKLSTKIRIIFSVGMIAALVEHLFFIATAMQDNQIQIDNCRPYSTIFWDNFLARNRPHLRYHFGYSPYLLPLYEVVNLWQTFCWNYSDIFIGLLAVGISFRFNQFNEQFRRVLNDESLITASTWRDMRVHYFKLVDLVYIIDNHVSGIILISMGHNMMVLILKIFEALKPTRHNQLNDIYFWFYILFLTSRILIMMLSSAIMNENAKKPLRIIRGIPSRLWNLDLQRLCDTISMEGPTLSFSGQQMFFITKSSVLALIASILTFEIFLLDEIDQTEEPFCTLINQF